MAINTAWPPPVGTELIREGWSEDDVFTVIAHAEDWDAGTASEVTVVVLQHPVGHETPGARSLGEPVRRQTILREQDASTFRLRWGRPVDFKLSMLRVNLDVAGGNINENLVRVCEFLRSKVDDGDIAAVIFGRGAGVELMANHLFEAANDDSFRGANL